MIYPPRPEDCIPPDMDLKWIKTWHCQLKHNDTRTVIHIDTKETKIYNRHKEPMRKHHISDQLTSAIQTIRDKLGLTHDSILDGGLLGDSLLILWDILRVNGKDQIGTTYQQRHLALHRISTEENIPHLGHYLAPGIYTPHNYTHEEKPLLWKLVSERNATENKIVLEGIVYKDPTATLEPMYKQKNNTTWMVKSRIQTGRHRF